jgi:4-amino-4-deoxy-L-arabinose transferase-like glycosyltransferase
MKVRRGQALSAFLLVVGLGFAFLGQLYFTCRREYVRDGVFFWCVALLAFGLLFRRAGRTGHRRLARQPAVQQGRSRWLRPLVALCGALCAVAAGWRARQMSQAADFSGVFWLWLFGVYWFLMALVPAFKVTEAWLRLLQWLRRNWIELTCLAVLLLAALAVRGVNLEHIPANLGGDEGTWGMEALGMFDGGRLANPFATRWFSFPSLSFLAWGLSMGVFGASVAGLRAISALIGTATVLTTFVLARELWGRRVAWLAAILLTFGHYHIHYSRLAVNNIADGLLVTLALYLLVRGLRSGTAIHFALAGAVIGLGWYGYVGARLIGIIAAVYLTWRAAVEYRFLARYGRLLALAVAAALVVAAPLLLYYAVKPAELTAGVSRVSILVPGWLAREKAYWGVSAAAIYWRQVWKSLSGFHYTLDPVFWYHTSIPLLDFVSGALLILGMVWALARRHWPANGLLLIWFWLALITGWVLTENPPSSQRMVINTPALALLAGLGLNELVGLGERVVGGGRSFWAGAASALLVAVAAINLRYYFIVYTPALVYGNPSAEVATVLGRSLAQRDGGCVVYFHAPPVMYWDIGNLRFLLRVYAPEIQGMSVYPPGEGEPLQPDLNRNACFVFLPERLGELETIRAQYPGGAGIPAYSEADGRLLYVLYEVDNEQ